MRNSQRQDSQLSTIPPSTGPRIGPRAAGRLTVAIVLVRDSGVTLCIARVCISGNMIPPPTPWRMRKAIRDSAFHAHAHSAEPRTNRPSANSHSRLPPNRFCAQLTKGIVIASASR